MSNLIDQNSLAAGFWDAMEPTDFSVPRVSIGQPTSTKGLPGHFNFNSGVSHKEMNNCKLIIPMKTRVLYHDKGRSRCASDNYYQPSSRIHNPVTTNCLVCPMAQWGESPEKEAMIKELGGDSTVSRTKPLCTETYNLLMADEHWSPFFIAFQKAQLKIVQEKLFSRLKYQHSGVPPFHMAFDMKLVAKKGPRSSYYEVEFSNFREAEGKETGTALAASWRARAQDVLAKQHNDMDSAKDVTPSDDEPPF